VEAFLVADALRVEKQETGVVLIIQAKKLLENGEREIFVVFFIVFIFLGSSRFRGGSSNGAFGRIITARR